MSSQVIARTRLHPADSSAFVEYAVGCKAKVTIEGRVSAVTVLEDGRAQVTIDASDADVHLDDVRMNGTHSLRTWMELRKLARGS